MIGDPVRHSLSPRVHNAAFAALGLDWVYVALPVAAGRGGEVPRAMATLGIEGLSVTMPHKADVARSLERLTPAAQRLGACNCVFYGQSGQLTGDTTDGDGLFQALKVESGVTIAGARVMVIGTGGAARSIIEAAGRHGAADIVVVSRQHSIVGDISHLAPTVRAGSDLDIRAMDVIINATPIGMAGGPAPDQLPIKVDEVDDHHTVVDIVYQPRLTPLLAQAAQQGATTVDGVGMLIHQAALAFEHWTGMGAPIDVMRAAGLAPSNP